LFTIFINDIDLYKSKTDQNLKSPYFSILFQVK
jgi:hypothetical protein